MSILDRIRNSAEKEREEQARERAASLLSGSGVTPASDMLAGATRRNETKQQPQQQPQGNIRDRLRSAARYEAQQRAAKRTQQRQEDEAKKVAERKARYEELQEKITAYDSVSKEMSALMLNPDYAGSDRERVGELAELKSWFEEMGKDIDAIKAEYEKLAPQVRQDNWNAENARYGTYLKAEDFAEHSKKGSEIPSFVNNGSRNYSGLTEDEKNVYYYLLSKEGNDSANKFLDHMQEALNARTGAADAKTIQGIENDFLRGAASIGYSGIGAVSGFVDGMQQAFTDEVTATPSSVYGTQIVRENTDSDFVKTAMDVAGVVGGQAVPYLVAVAMSHIPGLQPVAAKLAAGTLMGMSVKGNKYKEGLARGMTEDQAQGYSVLVGASEGALGAALGGISSTRVTESKLLAKALAIDNGIMRALAVGGVHVGNEIVEEELQNYLEPLFRTIVTGEEYDAPTVEELTYTALVTALSTGILEAPSMINAGSNRVANLGEQLKGLGDDTVQAIIEEGLATDKDTVSRNLAQSMQDKLARGEKLTAQEVGALYRENVQTVESAPAEAQDPLEAAAREVVARKNEAAQEASQAVQRAPVNVMANDNPTVQQRKTLEQIVKAKTGYGEEGVKSFVNLMEQNNDGNIDKLRSRFQVAYETGLTDAPANMMKFDNGVQEAAFQAGKRDFALSQKKQPVQAKVNAKAGFIANDMSADNLPEGVKPAALPQDVTPLQVKILDQLGKETGTRIRIVSGLKGNGEIRGNEALIDASFMRERNGKKLTVVSHALHEVGLHRLMQLAPGDGRAFINSVIQYKNEGLPANAPTVSEKRRDSYAAQGENLTTEGAMEEIAADDVWDLFGDDEAVADFLQKVKNGKDEQAKKGARKFMDIMRDLVQKVRNLVAKLTGREKVEAKQVLTDLEGRLALYEKAFKSAVENRKGIENRALQEYNGGEKRAYEEVKHSAKERVWKEDRRAFEARNRGKVLERTSDGSFTYAYEPVYRGSESAAARQIQEELTRLGVPCFVYRGSLEANNDAYTAIAGGNATTIKKEVVAVNNDFDTDIDPVEAAGHEAFHYHVNQAYVYDYIKVLAGNLDIASEEYKSFQRDVSEMYLGKPEPDYQKTNEVRRVVEEVLAFISGYVHGGKHEAFLPSVLKDVSAVKDAWQRATEQMQANVAKQYDGDTKYSLVTDEETLDFLDNQKLVKVYRAMQEIDGKLYPPMAALIKGDTGKKQLVEATEKGKWYQADEHPELIKLDKSGKPKFELNKGNGAMVPAAYNPYFHTSMTPLNDQFSSAYDRPNIVVVEGYIPSSELTSGYKAQYAKDSVGETTWHAGPVASKLKGAKARRVYLSRWFKADRVVPTNEVAKTIAETLKGENLSVPWNVVTPELRKALEKQGVSIDYKDIKMGSKVVTFESTQPKFSLKDGEYAPTFYSQMERTIEAVKQDKLGAASVVSMLRGKGVKAEEIKWSGIETFLEGKKSVTKQELLEFVRGNQLQVEEQMLGAYWTTRMNSETGEAVESYEDFMSQAYDLAEAAGIDPDDVRLEDYGDEWLAWAHNSETGEDIDIASTQTVEPAGTDTKWEDYKLDGGKYYREYLFKLPGSRYSNQAMRAHWDYESGVLAHARVQDFEHNGEPVLFIEEIQSDWHNEGHKKGYAAKGHEAQENDALADIRRRIDALREKIENDPELSAILDKLAPGIIENNRRFGQEIDEAIARGYAVNMIMSGVDAEDVARRSGVELSVNELMAIDDVHQERNILATERALARRREDTDRELPPEAPYSKTYHEFVLKNLLRKAAEGGYAYLGWTTGEMQEERWSSEYAEGYRIEYDQDIPKFLNKYGKQWGAKTEDISLDGLRNVTVHAIPITKAMKQSVLYEGQPKFSLKDSEGNELTKEQQDFFKDSKVRDENGNLLVMYHGTPNAGFTKFRSGSYFTQHKEWADVYQSPSASSISAGKALTNPDTYAVYLNITKPFDTRNPKERRIFREEFYRQWGTGTPLADSGLPDWIDGMDLQEFIEENGYDYDGLILDEGAVGGYGEEVVSRGLSYVTFSPEQVKDIDNKTPTDDPDMRFSLKEQDDILAENAKLKEVNAALREQFQTTKFAKVERKSLEKFAKQLLKDYSSGADINDTRDALDGLYTYMANGIDGQSAVWEEAYQMAYDVALEVLNNAVTLDDSLWQAYKPLRDHLRKVKITLAKEDWNDLEAYGGYNEFRKANMGRLNLVKDGVPVDVAYQEMAYLWPEYFNEEEHTHPADQLVHMAEVLDGLQPIESNPYAVGMRESATWLANDIMERFFELPQAKPTFADKAERKLTQQVIKDRKKLEALREQKDQKIAKIIKQQREKTAERIKKEKADKWKKAAEVKEHYQTKEKRMSESRKARVMRAKIMRHASELQHKLLRPTDKQHVPESLRKPVAALLDAINLESGFEWEYGKDGAYHRVKRGSSPFSDTTNRTKAFLKVRQAYEKILKDGAEYDGAADLVVDPDSLAIFDQVLEMRDVPIAEMTSRELETIWDAVRLMEHSVSTAGKMLSESKHKTTAAMAEAFQEDTASRKDVKSSPVLNQLKQDLKTPYTFFSNYGQAGLDFFQVLLNAQSHEQRMQNEIAAKVSALVSKEKREALEKETVQFNGMTFSKAHVMGLYLLSKREQAVQHMTHGGIVQPEIGKIKRGVEPRMVPEMDLVKLQELLTADERKLADEFQKLTLQLAEWGNQAAMKAYGYRKFTDPHYWPIRSASEQVNQTVEKNRDNARSIANMGSAKALNPNATNGLEVESIFETFDRHASDMMTYSAWLIPMEDANRLFNFKFKDEDGNLTGRNMQTLLNKVGGPASTKYWLELMKDIQNGIGGANDTGLARLSNKIIGNVKKASVAGNLRVVVQQPTAMMRAAAVLKPENLARFAKAPTKGSGWDKAMKYAPIAARKATGGFEVSANPKQLAEIMYKPETKKGKAIQGLKDAPMWAPGKADEMTWGFIWNACEWQVAEDKSLDKGSESFYKATAKLFEEVIVQTQVVDGVLQRSQAMRSSNGAVKQMTSFMGEPTQTLNMVMRAYDNFRNETDPGKRTSARKKLATAAAAVVFNGVLNAMAQSIIDATRDDDEEKEYLERYMTALTGLKGDEDTLTEFAKAIFLDGNLGSNLNPANWVYYLSDVVSLLQGYSIERMDASAFGDFLTAASNMEKAIAGESKWTPAYAAAKLLTTAGKLFGSSSANIMRDVESLLRTVLIAGDNWEGLYESDKMKYDLVNQKNHFLDFAYQAYAAGNTEAYEAIVEDMAKNGVDRDAIKSGMESRMKKAQGVSKVEDLTERYLFPDQEAEYDRTMSRIKSSSVWKNASGAHKDKVEDKLYEIVTGSKAGMDLQEKITEGGKYGIDETEYLLYTLALDMHDKANDNGKYGTYTNQERAEAILGMGLKDNEMAYLWDKEEGYEALAAGVRMEKYIQFKADLDGIKATKNALGKVIVSREDKIIQYLNKLGVTNQEKRWLLGTVYDKYK